VYGVPPVYEAGGGVRRRPDIGAGTSTGAGPGPDTDTDTDTA
jgi:hypothetical protein